MIFKPSFSVSSHFFSRAVQLVSIIQISHHDPYPFLHRSYWRNIRDIIEQSENISVKLNEKLLGNTTLVSILVTETIPSTK